MSISWNLSRKRGGTTGGVGRRKAQSSLSRKSCALMSREGERRNCSNHKCKRRLHGTRPYSWGGMKSRRPKPCLQLNTAAPQKGRGAGNPPESGGLTTAAVFKADRRFLCPFLGQPLFGRQKRRNLMAFFNSAVDVLQTLVIALGAGLGIWGVINLLEGYGNDNPGANAHVQ